MSYQDSSQVLKDKFDICVLGQAQTGKTSLVLHYLYDEFVESTTSGVEELHTKSLRFLNRYSEVSILDSSSELDLYNNSRRQQILNTNNIILVYSINDMDSFLALHDIMLQFKTIRPDIPPIAIIATKSDLQHTCRQVSWQDGQEFAEQIGAVSFIECSAKEGTNIEEAFLPIITKALESQASRVVNLIPSKTNLTSAITEQTSHCPSLVVSTTMSDDYTASDESQGHIKQKKKQAKRAETEKNRKASLSQNKNEATKKQNAIGKEFMEDTTHPKIKKLDSSASERNERHYTRELKDERKKHSSGCCVIV
ncbi:uncharacterized protein J8A68_002017 [[Candida] subhashii]|uniref:Uncharacterized protein n=1 Tax=[Candida] subhashii TaxID=561895 RepID=A0A8J5QGX8_9ASCO|nr:uncharacterized protein J8A68_002017 [[Candida] subhashii]KAG7664461.1 hypothetical protein J8A68_002017 [[Candida] subhashii]